MPISLFNARGKTPMKTIIMQPTYLPWIGYFSLIHQADYFVFLDNVQFEKQSWQQRNRILGQNGLEWITVPVLIKGRFGQLIRDVEISSNEFYTKHIKQIQQNYRCARYYDDYAAELFDRFAEYGKKPSLCNLNIALIEWFSRKLCLNTQFIRASDLNAGGRRSERLINILKELGSSLYISPMGSVEYIRQDYPIFKSSNITVLFENYVHPEYRQVYNEFTPFASIVDLLLNEGPDSLSVIVSGQKDNLTLKEISIWVK